MPSTTLPDAAQSNFKADLKMMSVALIAGVLLMGIKFVGYAITGSTAILSDALESIINVVAGGFGLCSILLSSKPPDESHPYGHGKIEFFAAGFEGALIIAAAVGIFYEGLQQIINPAELHNLQNGLFFIVFSAMGNLVLALSMLRISRRTKSLVLEADAKHLFSDVFSTGAVVLGVFLVYVTGRFRLDGVVACIAGINIVFWGSKLLRSAVGGLMHRSEADLLDEICEILVAHKREPWIDVHRLRAWRSGKLVHLDFHLILPRDLTLEAAHKEVKDLENIFSDHFHGMADVLIHLDPCFDPTCAVCENAPCNFRKRENHEKADWIRSSLTRESVPEQ